MSDNNDNHVDDDINGEYFFGEKCEVSINSPINDLYVSSVIKDIERTATKVVNEIEYSANPEMSKSDISALMKQWLNVDHSIPTLVPFIMDDDMYKRVHDACNTANKISNIKDETNREQTATILEQHLFEATGFCWEVIDDNEGGFDLMVIPHMGNELTLTSPTIH